MPAGRDTDWTHVRVIGSRAAAAPYLPFGRKLLGFVRQDAAHNGLQTHKVRKWLPDGALIVAEVHGLQPIITIVPPVRGGGDTLMEEDRIVVLARWAGGLAGIDADHPEQWLDVPGETRDIEDGWATRFHDASIPAYETFAGEKGVYATLRNRKAFPNGTRHAGNCDHRNTKGERVSWYGPACRVLTEAYVVPHLQYGAKVFALGKPIIDFEEEGDGLPTVYGAGLHGGWLYVAHGDMPPIGDYDIYDEAGEGAGRYYDTEYNVVTFTICRYRASLSNPGTGAARRVVSYASKEVLWTSAQPMGRHPWVFAPDCSSALHTGNRLADGHTAIAMRITDPCLPSASFDTWEPVSPYPFAEYADLTTVELPSGAVTVQQSSIPAGDGRAILCRDFDEDGNIVTLDVVRGPVEGEAHGLLLACGDTAWPTLEWPEGRSTTWQSLIPPYSPQSPDFVARRRGLLFADLRHQLFVFVVQDVRFAWDNRDPGTGDTVDYRICKSVGYTIEVWRDGALLHSESLGTATRTYADSPLVFPNGYTMDTYTHPSGANYSVYRSAALEELSFDTGNGTAFFDALNTRAISPLMAMFGTVYRVHLSTTYAGFGASSTFVYQWAPQPYYWWIFGLAGVAYRVRVERITLFDIDLDVDSHYIPTYCAVLGDAVVLSTQRMAGPEEYASYDWISDTTLEEKTGTTGSFIRFRPAWCIGRFVLPPPNAPITQPSR